MVAVQTAGRSRSLTFDPTVALFGTVAFTGAALLFLIEPVVAKMALPRLGGSPAVWNTSLMFFQIVLLVGYGYAHLSTQRLGLRAQVTVHAVALAAPLLVLPVALPHWSPPGASAPIPWLLGLLVVTVGLPFFVVSTASPLTQRWFSARGHRLSADPYFLYAAGNAGSLLGLLSYPFLIEPRYTLAEQASLWSKGYVIFALLTALAGFSLVRHEGRVRSRGADTRSTTLTAHPGVQSATTMIAETTAAAEAPKWPLRARWIFFAFIPSSLMMGVTSYLTTDIASLPLLWMLPLSVYLVTFILAFSPRNPLPPAVANKLLFVTVIPFALTSVLIRRGPLLAIGLHLLALFVAAMLCHGRLNEERPNAKRLTEFFFFVSLGGVLGGVIYRWLSIEPTGVVEGRKPA